MVNIPMLERPAPATTVALSPERMKLAARIEARGTGMARLAGLRGVIERGNEAVWRAREAVAGALEAVMAAPSVDAKAAASALLAGEPQPIPNSAAARAGLDLANETLAAAIFARDSVQAEIADLEGDEAQRERGVADAMASVIRVESAEAVRATIAELATLYERLADRSLALRVLMKAGAITDRGPDATPGLMTMMARFHNVTFDWSPDTCPTAAAWQATIDALKIDAAAPVPK
jgi:hypothetical protein